MLKDINDIKDTYNKIRQIENKLHKVKTLHSLGKLDVKETKTERHYYYYKRLYGHPVKPAGKVH